MKEIRLSLAIVLCSLPFALLETGKNLGDSCFCELKGEIDDCSCTIEGLDAFNNLKIYPRLNSLLEKDYFRYWKTNLRKGCPFWADDSKCTLQDCKVDGCKDEDLPSGLKTNGSHKNKYTKQADEAANCDDDEHSLGDIDTTLSDKTKEAFKDWSKYDDAQSNFCELDDEEDPDSEFIDMILNPEGYTGYKGDSPHRIWRAIYKENCFPPDKRDYKNFIASNSGLCLEKRTFFRMISGLHTSINVHLTANYLLKEPNALGIGAEWGPHLQEFLKRFAPENTYGEGPKRLKNLYFTYLVELRALAKAAPYLTREDFYTGSDEEDNEVQAAITDLLKTIKTFPNHFDESKLFKSGDVDHMAQLKEEFKVHFRNISRIMDCVGCDRCRLWGKVQIVGMGTALKILFSGDNMTPDSIVTQEHKKLENPFQLRRGEIVALFNAVGRLSKCIFELENFRQMKKN